MKRALSFVDERMIGAIGRSQLIETSGQPSKFGRDSLSLRERGRERERIHTFVKFLEEPTTSFPLPAPLPEGEGIAPKLRRFQLLLFFFLVFLSSTNAHAQLATSFSNLTAIQVSRLPNAVVVRIETDGTIRFGGDQTDWIDFDNYSLKPTQSVRLRIVQARAKLPAYVPIDAYPLDGAVISPGRSDFEAPFFQNSAYGQPEPRVDVELRFAAPVIIRRFSVDDGQSISFGDYLNPREASIELSADRRAIIVTIIPDRSDLTGLQRLNRSPPEARKQKLSVTKLSESNFRVEALHSPLRTLLGEIARNTGWEFVAREEIAAEEVSLFLPSTTPREFLEILTRSSNLGAREENGVLVLGRGDEFFSARSLPLFNLSPDAARLLFPDFLLPYLRPDRQNNTLLGVQTPLVLDKIEAQLRRIDIARAQFEVVAQLWELSSTKEDNTALRLLRSLGGDRQSLDFESGEALVRIEGGQTDQLGVTLRALSTRGRARLVGNPRVSVLSGARGTLFLGQLRYVNVIQNRGNGQVATALPVRIGTQLDVTPRGSNQSGDPIRLDVSPRLSTVDDIEVGTGLPSLGLRELNGSLVVQENQAAVFAGLESDLDFSVRRRTLRVFPARRGNREVRALLVLISAKRIGSSSSTAPKVARVKRRSIAINPQFPFVDERKTVR